MRPNSLAGFNYTNARFFQMPAGQHMVDYAVDLARVTRPGEEEAQDFINDWLSWGAGPRAAQYLVLGAKARAILDKRYNVSTNDVRAMAHPVLRHRLITNFNADAEGINVEHIIDRLLATVPEPSEEDYAKAAVTT